MEEPDKIDMLTLAESVLVKSQKYGSTLLDCDGPFKQLFCSVMEENSQLYESEINLFSRPPKFEPINNSGFEKPIKNAKKKKIARVSLISEQFCVKSVYPLLGSCTPFFVLHFVYT